MGGWNEGLAAEATVHVAEATVPHWPTVQAARPHVPAHSRTHTCARPVFHARHRPPCAPARARAPAQVQFGHAGARSGGDAESAQVGGPVRDLLGVHATCCSRCNGQLTMDDCAVPQKCPSQRPAIPAPYTPASPYAPHYCPLWLRPPTDRPTARPALPAERERVGVLHRGAHARWPALALARWHRPLCIEGRGARRGRCKPWPRALCIQPKGAAVGDAGQPPPQGFVFATNPSRSR